MQDLIVLSDLHLGRGRNPETGRYYALEAFFYDDDLQRFLAHVCREAEAQERSFRLILNGDTFDLLRIEENAKAGHAEDSGTAHGIASTPTAAARTVQAILSGHPRFVDGLAGVLAAGHEVIMLPGNHDVEVQWQPVQEEVRAALRRSLEGQGTPAEEVEAALARYRLEPWFHYEAGRVWIEHGNQYDPENSFRHFLRGGLADDEETAKELDRDLPLGSFFQRYLYNAFGSLTFIVPSSRAHWRYLKWLLFNKPRILFRLSMSHGPFFFQVLRRVAQQAAGNTEALQACHERKLEELAKETGLGDKLRAVEEMKRVRPDVAQAAGEVVGQLSRLLRFAAIAGMLALGVWFSGFYTINRLPLWLGLPLFLVLNLLLLLGVVATAYALLRSPQAPAVRPLRDAAVRIADGLDVPVVVFGHTHEESIRRLDRAGGEVGWYFNTGTWIAVFTHDEMLPRERVQLSYLRVRDHEAELLHWSPGRGEPVPVILLDDDTVGTAAPA
jgi:UDP-2,3-diacylglucosamine pyrophosphatase LpxH